MSLESLNLSKPPECLLSPAHDADYRNDALLASIPPHDTHHHMIVVCDYDLSSLAIGYQYLKDKPFPFSFVFF